MNGRFDQPRGSNNTFARSETATLLTWVDGRLAPTRSLLSLCRNSLSLSLAAAAAAAARSCDKRFSVVSWMMTIRLISHHLVLSSGKPPSLFFFAFARLSLPVSLVSVIVIIDLHGGVVPLTSTPFPKV